MRKTTHALLAAASPLLFCGTGHADVIAFQASDFGINPTFSNVRSFNFSIDLADSIVPGNAYTDPALNNVTYRVFGFLDPSPSGFSSFNLMRNIGSAEFYSQGSSLSFTVQPGADLSDGLQVSELSGVDPVFVFNGREVNTGRYHPAQFQLNADGTGSIQNSNNMGGINPASQREVNVNLGDEYITALTFNPNTLTLFAPIPEPSSLQLLAFSGLILAAAKRRKRRSLP